MNTLKNKKCREVKLLNLAEENNIRTNKKIDKQQSKPKKLFELENTEDTKCEVSKVHAQYKQTSTYTTIKNSTFFFGKINFI
jgi:hypothetical protein